MKVLVSACLLGENCKYNGGNNYNAAVAEFVKDKDVLPICPEMMAGMGCPRTPIEIVDGVLMDRDGNNVDAAMDIYTGLFCLLLADQAVKDIQ